MTRADQRKFHYIYKITRTDGSGKYYIGMHSTDNLEDGYFGSGTLLWHSIKKHGKEKHVMEVLEYLPSRAALRLREKELVNQDLLKDPLCLNLKGGGDGGLLTEEIKEKIRKSAIGREHSPQTKMKMSETRKNVPKSDVHRMNISASHLGKTGHKHTEETKKKLSDALLGRPVSEETRTKMSQTQKNKPRPVLTCPHCGKSGGNSNMVRYHFENCRHLS